MMSRIDIISNKFVELIEENHREITELYMNDLLKGFDTGAYRQLERSDIYESGNRIYRELSKWITTEYSKEEIAGYYKKLGRKRYNQGIPFSHVCKALVLLKRHLWIFVQSKMDYDLADYKRALEMNNRVVLYFDRATFYMLQGFEEMIHRKW